MPPLNSSNLQTVDTKIKGAAKKKIVAVPTDQRNMVYASPSLSSQTISHHPEKYFLDGERWSSSIDYALPSTANETYRIVFYAAVEHPGLPFSGGSRY